MASSLTVLEMQNCSSCNHDTQSVAAFGQAHPSSGSSSGSAAFGQTHHSDVAFGERLINIPLLTHRTNHPHLNHSTKPINIRTSPTAQSRLQPSQVRCAQGTRAMGRGKAWGEEDWGEREGVGAEGGSGEQ